MYATGDYISNPPQHSKYADTMRDEFSLWVKVKDRYSGHMISNQNLQSLADWLIDNHIMFERTRSNPTTFMVDSSRLRYADQFYLGIFPYNEIEMNAVKIAWGEVLSCRNL